MFSTGELVKLLLGIVTILPCRVMILEERIPISLTVPSIPLTIILSPTLNGLSTNTVIPPKILATKSFAAIAKARPPIPTPASNAPTSNPTLFIAVIIPNIQTPDLNVFLNTGPI